MPNTTIVVVDDSADDIFFIKRVFEAGGIFSEFVVAEDAHKAIRLLSSPMGVGVRVVFIDIQLPGMNGLEFLEWLRGQSSLVHIKAVMLSASDDPAHFARARALGAQGYLVKYPSPAKAAAILAWVLSDVKSPAFPTTNPR